MPRVSGFYRPLALALAAVWLAVAPAAHAADAQPAKKDSPLRVRPPGVDVTASATPVEAKPGETVAFKVTAKLKPGWHIYTYAKEQPGEGPRATQFDLFDPAGLTPMGDWTPSKPPVTRQEPAFPNLDSVSFYEDEVSWTLDLKVPADAKPGSRTLRCQASYQICDAKSCSFPGRWTLPDVVINVVGAGAVQAEDVGAAPKPKVADSSDRIKPQGVTLTPSLKPAEAKPGETVTLSVKARVSPPWHIYDYAAEQPAQGPRATQFDLFDLAGLTPEGDWEADRPPVVKQEAAFNNLIVTYFENEVTWSLKLKVPADAKPGSKTIRTQAGYQVCDETSCLPFVRSTLPEVALAIVPGEAGATATAAAPVETPKDEPKAGVVAAKPEEPTATAPTEASKEEPKVAAAPTKSMPGLVDATPNRTQSEVEQTAQRGILPLMVMSALGGLLALVMPCVWPMVPITVNFFVKQGEKNPGKTTALAVAYCLAIIGVFTTLGVLASFFVSATALPRLANSPWLNLFVAALFIAFGLSLLGFFEISLPSSWLNASARGESRGGLVGVMFMALTLTITSFTCTFPVVGGLLVMASTGQVFYPVVGLATFATVLALPFFLLALSPGLLSKVPRSGDWMNSVKVVGGLIELGAALKFLNSAELAFVTADEAWINAQLMLTVWVVLAGVCGFYLLGFFRTDHDHEEVRIGAGRMLLGSGFLAVGLFFAPALFGRPPQSPIWNMIVGFLPDAARLGQTTVGAAAGEAVAGADVHATDPDPEKAQRQEKKFHGVVWGFSYEEALERAKAENKPSLIDCTGVNCVNCRTMEQTVLPRAEVVAMLKKFVTIELYTDYVQIGSITPEQRQALAEKNQNRQLDLTNDASNPFYVVLSPDGKLLGAKGGLMAPGTFVDFLSQSLDKSADSAKMAQVGAR